MNNQFTEVILSSNENSGLPNNVFIKINNSSPVFLQVNHYITNEIKIGVEGLRIICNGQILKKEDTITNFLSSSKDIPTLFVCARRRFDLPSSSDEQIALETKFIVKKSEVSVDSEKSGNSENSYKDSKEKVDNIKIPNISNINNTGILINRFNSNTTNSSSNNLKDISHVQSEQREYNLKKNFSPIIEDQSRKSQLNKLNITETINELEDLIKKIDKRTQPALKINQSNIQSNSQPNNTQIEEEEQRHVEEDTLNNLENQNEVNNWNNLKLLVKILFMTFIMTYSSGEFVNTLRVLIIVVFLYSIYVWLFNRNNFNFSFNLTTNFHPKNYVTMIGYGIYLFFASMHPSFTPQPIQFPQANENINEINRGNE